MKRTELEKRERELKRSRKKETVLERKTSTGRLSASATVGDFIDALFSKFRYDQEEIFNIKTEIQILEILEDLKTHLPEKQWENVLKKAVKKTNIAQKDKAYSELQEMMGS